MLKQLKSENSQSLSQSAPKYRLAVVTSHPVQYQAPLLRLLAQHEAIDLTVYYGDDRSLVGGLDPGFGISLTWDRPLLEGYKSSFLTRAAMKLSTRQRFLAHTRIISELRQQDYDAVFINSYAKNLSLLAYLGAWLSRTPVLLRTESQLLTPKKWYVRLAKKILLSALFRVTSGFLTIGTANRQFYANYGVKPDRMYHTPYSVDNDFFNHLLAQNHLDRATIKKALGFKPDLPVIMFSGKLQELKRLDTLLEAYHKLTARGVEASLLLVGDGEMRPRLEAYIEEHRLNQVHFAGFKNQTELPAYYSCGDIFVLPSRTETWGLVVNEAMLFGMPVVVSDKVGCGQDLVLKEETGYIYPMGDAERLADILQELLLDPEKRQRLGNAGRQRIASWSYQECVEGILEALHDVKARSNQAKKAKKW